MANKISSFLSCLHVPAGSAGSVCSGSAGSSGWKTHNTAPACSASPFVWGISLSSV